MNYPSFSGIYKIPVLFIIVAIFMMSTGPGYSQGSFIASGTTVTINPSTFLYESGDMTLSSGGTLNNQGTMILKGDLDNQNSTASSLGTGTIEFSGTASQSISGPNIFGILKINNSSGVYMVSGNMTVTSSLNLASGRLTLGTCNLALGNSATVTGTFNASNMVVADSTGQFRKIYGSTGSFTFPVGDNTSTAEYSPVTLNFSAGTFGTDAYAGVNLRDRRYADPGITGDYITRYWNISSSGITTFTCNSTFTYVAADISGTESNTYCIRISPAATFNQAGSNQLVANSLTSFSTFTGAHGGLTANLVAYLEGPYSTGSDIMTNTLATSLTLGDRSDNTKFPQNQPYNGSPWSYSGTESVTSLPSGVVDWVLLELRHASSSGNASSTYTLGKRAAFLKTNGSIVDIDGTSPVTFSNLASFTDNLYIIVYHRNHIAILANNAVTRDANQVYTYDYSSGSGQVYGGTNGYKQIDTSPVRWGMIAADATNDGNIYVNDYTDYWVPDFGLTSKYKLSDFNLDANVYLNDYTDFWVPNFGKTNPLP